MPRPILDGNRMILKRIVEGIGIGGFGSRKMIGKEKLYIGNHVRYRSISSFNPYAQLLLFKEVIYCEGDMPNCL
jgi:hypothetical protein